MKPTTTLTVIISLPDESQQPLIDWLAGGWCQTIEVKQQATEAQLRALRERGFDIVMTMPSHPTTRANTNRNRGLEHAPDEQKAMPDDVGRIIKPMIRVFDGDRAKVKWQCFVEEDSSGVALPRQILPEKPATYQAAWQMREQRIDELLAVAAEFPDIQLYAVAGFATTAHALMRRERFNQINLERTNDDIDDLQTGIAFMRGAAKQYNKPWGIDFSLWWGPIYGTIVNLPASYHRRSLYLSYFSGATELVMEGMGEASDNLPQRIPPLPAVVKEVGHFIQKHPAGQADAPVAVMLAEDHGWMTPPYWDSSRLRWNYARLRARPGDRGIDGFFGQAFPGNVYTMDMFPFGKYVIDEPRATPFALSCITPWFDTPTDLFEAYPALPFGQFHDRNQARQWMHENQVETADYRPMGDSRWGDIFDVLTTEAASEVLRQYHVLILLGQITLNTALKEKLCDYVKAGGTLICAAGVVGPEDEDMTGLRMQPRHRIGRAWRANGGDNPWTHESLRYIPAEVIDLNTTIVEVEEASGEPLVVRHPLGNGKVYTCLAVWYEGANADLAGPASVLFDRVVSPQQPWRVSGLPIEWLSTHGEDHRTLVLANHSEQPWTGTIHYLNPKGDFRPQRVVELITGQPLPGAQPDQPMTITIPPREIAACRLYEK